MHGYGEYAVGYYYQDEEEGVNLRETIEKMHSI
jgi:hypothetical protein